MLQRGRRKPRMNRSTTRSTLEKADVDRHPSFLQSRAWDPTPPRGALLHYRVVSFFGAFSGHISALGRSTQIKNWPLAESSHHYVPQIVRGHSNGHRITQCNIYGTICFSNCI